MSLALAVAKATVGQTSPNPVVGAVLVKNGKLLSIGTHVQAGSHHAEINAIKAANTQDVAGATLYVTLEPCCHIGKTGACTDAIIAHGIKRVVIATMDKNPLVAGGGVNKLTQAGIEVEVGVCESEARSLNAAFFHFVSTKLPYITLKSAVSINAKLATANYQSKWITGEKARQDAQYYRRTHDAILVGVNTIIYDDPLLTCRIHSCTKQPTRVILDSTLKLSDKYQVITDNQSTTVIITASDYNRSNAQLLSAYAHVKLIHLTTSTITIGQVLEQLVQLGITSILVEGGAQVHRSFIEHGLFNQLVLYVAPKLIGGVNAPGFFDSIHFTDLSQAIPLKFIETTMLGSDLKIIAAPLHAPADSIAGVE